MSAAAMSALDNELMGLISSAPTQRHLLDDLSAQATYAETKTEVASALHRLVSSGHLRRGAGGYVLATKELPSVRPVATGPAAQTVQPAKRPATVMATVTPAAASVKKIETPVAQAITQMVSLAAAELDAAHELADGIDIDRHATRRLPPAPPAPFAEATAAVANESPRDAEQLRWIEPADRVVVDDAGAMDILFADGGGVHLSADRVARVATLIAHRAGAL